MQKQVLQTIVTTKYAADAALLGAANLPHRFVLWIKLQQNSVVGSVVLWTLAKA